MNLPKQFINLLGAIVTVGIMVLGIVVIALPAYSGAGAISAQAAGIAQTNDVYQVQVDQLSDAADRKDEIDAHVAELRKGISAIPQLDDVYEIIVAVATETSAGIESITASDPETWTPRVSPDTADAPAAAAPTDSTSADAAATTDADAATPAPAAPDATSSDSPRRQIPLTITVKVTDAAAAASFIDALGRGPRLILPVDNDFSAGKLTINALAFIRTEG